MLHNNRSNYSYVNAVTGTNTASASIANSSLRTGDTNLQNTGNINLDTPSLETQNLNVDNNSHPLYLHNNDQPGMILISKKLLGLENYSSRKRSIQIALSAKIINIRSC